jgi:hypothetical protein
MDYKPNSLGRNWGEATIGTFGSAPRCQKQPAGVAQLAKHMKSPKFSHAFEEALTAFHPEHLDELLAIQRMNAIVGGPGHKELRLDLKPIAGAYQRISAAVAEDQEVSLSGVFGGVVVFSGNFEFQPDSGELIRGSLDPELSEDAAKAMNRDFTRQRAVAKLKMTTISTRAVKRRPSYELTRLLPTAESPESSKLVADGNAPVPPGFPSASN